MEFTQDAMVAFLKERGGRARSSDLLEHFKAVFPEEPWRRAAVRDAFKAQVDSVAYVKTQSGVKYVCLRKKFRGSLKDPETEPDPPGGSEGGAGAGPRDDVPATGSGYGREREVQVPHVSVTASEDQEEVQGRAQMGNRGSFKREKKEVEEEEKEVQEEVRKGPADIPRITLIQATPLPADGALFDLPGPAAPVRPPCDSLPQGRDLSGQDQGPRPRNTVHQQEEEEEEEEGAGVDGGLLETHSEDEGSPRGSRQHFIEVMMRSSPEVRRSMVLGSGWSPEGGSDSASVVSSTPEEERASVTLDPLEHDWMMCSSDGDWGSLHRLLLHEPGLLLRRDFVTGFSCLHWAAKHGQPELIALIVNFAKQHQVSVSVDVRSHCGYTPLHVAAMHSHMEVVKLLVGAYGADVEIRDYSGKKACQYLTDNASVDIRDIIGAYESSGAENLQHKEGGRWRFSKVLQSNLRPLRLLHPNDWDRVDGETRPREPPLRKQSSFSRMRPKLQRLRQRTSQIFHSTTFHDREDLEGSGTGGSFRTRPKTHFFG